jgi:RHS repeat-associated protein
VRDVTGGAGVNDYLNGLVIDQKLRQTSSGSNFYFIQDHILSTNALTNLSGSVVERTQYEAFGLSVGSSLTRYGFTGREREPLTGLLFYRARWYDTLQGRFLTEDPISFRGGSNFYAYVLNNPVGFVDPYGLFSMEDFSRGLVEGGLSGFAAGVLLGAIAASGGTAAAVILAVAAFGGGVALGFEIQAILSGNLCDDEKSYRIGRLVGGFIGGGIGGRLGAGLAPRPAPPRLPAPYYPPNRGFLGQPTRTTLPPGSVIDRYGGPGGSFASPQGTSPWARSLPHGVEKSPLNAYEVIKPIEVDAGRAAPWFNQPGGGTQFDFGRSVQSLIDAGYLRPLR